MPRKILAPHRVQAGWVYWRLNVTTVKNAANAPTINPLWLVDKDTLACVKASDLGLGVGYADDTPGSRIISSRRVEEAVETADFLKLLTSEGLYASYWPDGQWLVAASKLTGNPASGTTLREAYYRHKAEAELDAQQPGPFGNETEPVDDERYCFNCYFLDTPDDGQPCQDCMNDENAHDQFGDWTRPEWEPAND
jgi:hypothetical protein